MKEDFHYDTKYNLNDDDEVYATYWVDENDQPVEPDSAYSYYTAPEGTAWESFIYPYAGCTDTHTYLEFLKIDVEDQGS